MFLTTAVPLIFPLICQSSFSTILLSVWMSKFSNAKAIGALAFGVCDCTLILLPSCSNLKSEIKSPLGDRTI